MIKFDGVIGVAIFLLTVGLLVLLVVVTFFMSAFRVNDATKTVVEQKSFDIFLTSAGILLVDLFIASFCFLGKTLSSGEAKSLDWWMLFVWCPMHLVIFPILLWLMRRFR